MAGIRSVEQFDNKQEREILIGMVVSKAVLARIAPRWTDRMFGDSKLANIIGGMCIRFFAKYQKAPGKAIERIAERWCEGKQDTTISQIENVLSSLSDSYSSDEELNAEVLIDSAEAYFKKVKLKKLSDDIAKMIQTGEVDKAVSRVDDFRKVSLPSKNEPIHFATDKEQHDLVFNERENVSLIQFDGDMKYFLGNLFEREGFVSFLGSQKAGKSYWLLDMAYRAVLSRQRTVYFQIGDLSTKDVTGRFSSRIAKHPIGRYSDNWPITLQIPTNISPPVGQSRTPEIEFKELTYDRPLNAKASWAACEKLMRAKVKSRESYFAIVHPKSTTFTALDIQSELETMELDGFIPDVVVIDYADNLHPIERKDERLDQMERTWRELRNIADQRHCLVITATQCNRKGYDAVTLRNDHIGQDNRKLNHVTGMVGINTFAEEKKLGVCRLNIVSARHQAFYPSDVLYCAGNLSIANPAILSAR